VTASAELTAARQARTDREVHPLITERYSPHAFADEAVPEPVVDRLLEAARWAPSSFNEQPWRFVVGSRSRSPRTRDRILATVAEGNQAWARRAPVLAITLAKRTFAFNGEDNPHAWHDVGLAMGQLTLQATHEGVGVHQMAGFDAQAAREAFDVSDEVEPVAAVAIGYPASPETLPDELAERAQGPRERRPLDGIVHREADEAPW
jgi:nitroreductase